MMVMISSCNMEGLEAGQQENIFPLGRNICLYPKLPLDLQDG